MSKKELKTNARSWRLKAWEGLQTHSSALFAVEILARHPNKPSAHRPHMPNEKKEAL